MPDETDAKMILTASL